MEYAIRQEQETIDFIKAKNVKMAENHKSFESFESESDHNSFNVFSD